MTLLIGLEQKPDEEIKKTFRKVIEAATIEFSPLKYEEEYPESGFGHASLRAKQLGLTYDYWQMSVTTSFADWINKTLGTNVYVIAEGIFNLTATPATTEIFPKANGLSLPYQNIENLYAHQERIGWFTKPFAVSPNNNITIQATGRFSQTEILGVAGHVIGKRSYLITAAP